MLLRHRGFGPCDPEHASYYPLISQQHAVQVLHVDPVAIRDVRALGLWELAYGPAFFFFGGQVRAVRIDSVIRIISCCYPHPRRH